MCHDNNKSALYYYTELPLAPVALHHHALTSNIIFFKYKEKSSWSKYRKISSEVDMDLL